MTVSGPSSYLSYSNENITSGETFSQKLIETDSSTSRHFSSWFWILAGEREIYLDLQNSRGSKRRPLVTMAIYYGDYR